MSRAVHQLLATLHYGDAIGNEALAIRGLLRRAGYDSQIFAERVDEPLREEARPLSQYRAAAGPETVCLFHFSVGDSAPAVAFASPGPLVLIYHNITPPGFFAGFSRELATLADEGERLLRAFAEPSQLALAKSRFSRRDLERAGFLRSGVLPILFDFARYTRPAAPVPRRMFRDGRTNLLFVGRVVPNKRVEDLIRVLDAFARGCDPGARLLLVGSGAAQDGYRRGLEALAAELGVAERIVFLGHVDDEELIAYYRVADLYLCLSEHEGFCVPLVEAMRFGVPVVAYDAGAVAETLGGAGILLRDKSPALVAELLHTVLSDPQLRRAVLATQERRLRDLQAVDYGKLLLERLAPVLAPAGGA